MVVTAAMVVIVVMAGGVRRPYSALQWVVGDPVAELVASSSRLPAAGSGRKQAVCDKWKIAYQFNSMRFVLGWPALAVGQG